MSVDGKELVLVRLVFVLSSIVSSRNGRFSCWEPEVLPSQPDTRKAKLCLQSLLRQTLPPRSDMPDASTPV